MKYVMFEKRTKGMSHLVPIIFPSSLVHADVAEALKTVLKGYKPTSAGEVSPMIMAAHGESTTLKLKANPRDTQVIMLNDYGVGFK